GLSWQIYPITLSRYKFIILITLFGASTIEFVGISGTLVEQCIARERVGCEFLVEAEFLQSIRGAVILPAIAANSGLDTEQANIGAFGLVSVRNPRGICQEGVHQFSRQCFLIG